MILLEINILESKKNEIQIEFIDESHTFLNILKSTLLLDEDVKVVTYNVEFPNISNPVLYLKTTKKDPITVLKSAASNLVNQCEEFKDIFNAKKKSG